MVATERCSQMCLWVCFLRLALALGCAATSGHVQSAFLPHESQFSHIKDKEAKAGAG